VIDMSKTGASGVSGWLGDIHGIGSPPRTAGLRTCGDVDRLSVPPATMTWSSPDRTAADAICTALTPAVPEPDGDVARDDTAALQRLTDHDVVDLGGRDPGPFDHRTHRDLRELERVDVDERSLARASDRRAGSGDDHGIGHGSVLSSNDLVCGDRS
jgi:hypothetical protein